MQNAQETSSNLEGRYTGMVVFNRAAMLKRLADDESLLQIVIAAFVEDTPKQIDLLRHCLNDGDLQGAKLLAHSIKGAAANAGGDLLREVAFMMEKMGNIVDLNAALEDLEREFERLKNVMEAGS